jgi:hypothetical protein
MATQELIENIDELRAEPMMAHLFDSLEAGEDIGRYGRLVFAMIARHFLSEDQVIEWLTKNPDFDKNAARGLVNQIEARGYNPPKRERILDWMRRQKFPICPEPQDRSQCNVYRNLQFPEEVYQKISEFYQSGGR